MADKPKIKKVKMELVLDREQRECLIQMLKGDCECVSLDNVCFEYFEVEDIKTDCCTFEGFECKNGKIKCLKMSACEPKCC